MAQTVELVAVDFDTSPAERALNKLASQLQNAKTNFKGMFPSGTTSGVDNLTRSAAQAGAQLQQTGNQGRTALNKVNNSATNLSSTFGRLKTLAAGIFAGFTTVRVTGAIVSNIREFERLEQVLNTVVGSAQEGARALDLIRKVTSQTPFQISNLTQAFIDLKTVGLDPTEQLLQQVADVAAATGKNVTDVSRAIQQAMTGQFEAMRGLGVLVKKEGEQFVITFQGMQHTIEGTNEAFLDFFTNVVSGEFAGGAAAQINTISGAISNLKDAFFDISVEIGKGGFSQAIQDVVMRLKDFVASGSNAAREFGRVMGEGVKLAGEALRFFIENIKEITTVLTVLVGAKIITNLTMMFLNLKGAVAAAGGAIRGFVLFLRVNPLTAVIAGVATAVASLVGYVGNLGKSMAEARGVSVGFIEILKEMGLVVLNRLQPAIDTVRSAIRGILDTMIAIGEGILAMGNRVANVFTGSADSVSQALAKMKDAAAGSINFVKEGIENIANEAIDNLQRKTEMANNSLRRMAEDSSMVALEAYNAAMEQEKLAEATRKAQQSQSELSSEAEKYAESLKRQTADLQLQLQLLDKSAMEQARVRTEVEATNAGLKQNSDIVKENIAAQQELIRAKAQLSFRETIAGIKQETALLQLNRKEREIQVELLREEQRLKSQGLELTNAERIELERALRARQGAQEAARERDRIEDEQKRELIKLEKEHQKEIENTAKAYEESVNRSFNALSGFGNALGQLIGKITGNQGLGRVIGSATNVISSIGRIISGGSLSGNVRGFAKGGIIDGPVGLFNNKGIIGVAGERGKEGILPLTKSSGRLGVQAERPTVKRQGQNQQLVVSGPLVNIEGSVDSRDRVDAIIEGVTQALYEREINMGVRIR